MIWDILAWLLFPTAIVFFGWATDDDRDEWFVGGIVTIGLLYAASYFTKLEVWAWIKDNYRSIPTWAIIYTAVGVGWSFLKFYSKARSITKDDIEKRARGYSSRVPSEDEIAAAKDTLFNDLFRKTPKWIAFWPASLSWSIASSWIKEIFVLVADIFKKLYRRMFDIMIGDSHD